MATQTRNAVTTAKRTTAPKPKTSTKVVPAKKAASKPVVAKKTAPAKVVQLAEGVTKSGRVIVDAKDLEKRMRTAMKDGIRSYYKLLRHLREQENVHVKLATYKRLADELGVDAPSVRGEVKGSRKSAAARFDERTQAILSAPGVEENKAARASAAVKEQKTLKTWMANPKGTKPKTPNLDAINVLAGFKEEVQAAS